MMLFDILDRMANSEIEKPRLRVEMLPHSAVITSDVVVDKDQLELMVFHSRGESGQGRWKFADKVFGALMYPMVKDLVVGEEVELMRVDIDMDGDGAQTWWVAPRSWFGQSEGRVDRLVYRVDSRDLDLSEDW